MTKIREMIRLHGQQQLSMHQISGSVNVSVSTVHRLLQKVREAGLSWPEVITGSSISEASLLKWVMRVHHGLSGWETAAIETLL